MAHFCGGETVFHTNLLLIILSGRDFRISQKFGSL
jgi:hypothetical protein